MRCKDIDYISVRRNNLSNKIKPQSNELVERPDDKGTPRLAVMSSYGLILLLVKSAVFLVTEVGT